ncbi:MAG: sigma 54-interacting transcriptional regulator [bacterium]
MSFRKKKVSSTETPLLEQLLEIGRSVLIEQDLNRVLAVAMDGLIESTGAERGLIILFDRHGKVRFQTARNLKREELEQPKYEISRSIIGKVKDEQAAVYSRNACEEPTFQASQSVIKLNILSVICLPLLRDGEVFGEIYLDNRTVRGAFKPENFQFAQKFAEFISIAAYHALERQQLQSNVHALQRELRQRFDFGAIVGNHPATVEILELIAQVADTDATILLSGESGTGKELLARALHSNSRRSDKPFVPINCGALPENLLESELFGHVRGAFTGATENKVGWFERAYGGTIFLDEIGEMSPAMQVKVLRILQTGEFSPVGSTVVRACDVRVVAATNKNLLQLIKEGRFREDLYYRLNVIGIDMPPLRERKSDIAVLAQHFIHSFGQKYNKKNLCLSEKAKTQLFLYDFPGNVRELENIIQRAVILAKGEQIETDHLPADLSVSEEGEELSFKSAKQRVVQRFEREYIIDRLMKSRGNISQAARASEMAVKNFFDKMKKYGIDPKDLSQESS